jgi:hypothetical protein
MKMALPLLFLLLFGVVSQMAAQTTSYTIGPSSTTNENTHLFGCPSSISSVDGQPSGPNGGICFLATSSGGDTVDPSSPYCAGPNNSIGQCFSAYVFDGAYGGNYYTDGCVYNTAANMCQSLPFPTTTYCAPPSVSGQACGVGSTYQVAFSYWFPQQQQPNPLNADENAWVGSLTINLQTADFYKVCLFRQPCKWVANNVITGGSGTVMPAD